MTKHVGGYIKTMGIIKTALDNALAKAKQENTSGAFAKAQATVQAALSSYNVERAKADMQRDGARKSVSNLLEIKSASAANTPRAGVAAASPRSVPMTPTATADVDKKNQITAANTLTEEVEDLRDQLEALDAQIKAAANPVSAAADSNSATPSPTAALVDPDIINPGTASAAASIPSAAPVTPTADAAAEQARKDAAAEQARKDAAAEQARKDAAEQARKDAAEQARKDAAAEQARKDAAAEQARKDAAAEQARKDAAAEQARKAAAEMQARQAAAEQARKDAEEQARQAAEEQARQAAEEQARQAAEEQARQAAEEQARKAAEEQARKAAEEQARKAAEEQARKDAEITAMSMPNWAYLDKDTDFDPDEFFTSEPADKAQIEEVEIFNYIAQLDALEVITKDMTYFDIHAPLANLVAAIQAQYGKEPTSALTEVLKIIHARITEPHEESYTEFENLAKTQQGSSSAVWKTIGALMIALSIALIPAGIGFIPALAAGIAAISGGFVAGTAATVAASTAVTATVAGSGYTGFRFFQSTDVAKAMYALNDATKALDDDRSTTAPVTAEFEQLNENEEGQPSMRLGSA